MVELKLDIRKRERLADQLYGQLLEKIVAGDLKEGDKLPSENEISRSFSVSRPVIREALLRLQADGLVFSRQGAGSFVKGRPPEQLIRFAEPSDVAGLLRCFEARMPIEGTIAALAAQRAGEEDKKAIAKSQLAFETQIARAGLADQEDFAFHMAIAKATKNDIFVSILSSLTSAVMSAMKVNLSITQRGSPERIRRVCEEHKAVSDAIKTGDAASAELSMRYHIHRARSRVTDRLRDQ